MTHVSCPHCCLPKVGAIGTRVKLTPGSAILLSASGVVTLGASWAVLAHRLLRGDYRPKTVYHCYTCGYEWSG